MTKKVLAVYDRTLRRVSLIHTLTRAMVWNLGELGVKTLSKITRFDLPNERLLPLFRLPMLLGTYEMDTVRTCKQLVRPGMTEVHVGKGLTPTFSHRTLRNPKVRHVCFQLGGFRLSRT